MKFSLQEIAEYFSNGKFDKTTDYLNENIIWNVVGERIFHGKKAVLENCNQTAAYFKTVETDFKTEDVICLENKVIITGTAEFKKDGKSINFVSACDIYEFNEVDEIAKITSYCISEKKN